MIPTTAGTAAEWTWAAVITDDSKGLKRSIYSHTLHPKAVIIDPLLTLAVVLPCFFAFGVLMHWLLARFAITPFNSLLVTFGLTVIIESAIQWIWTADYRRLESHYGDARFRLGTLYISLPDLLTLAAAVLLCLGTWAAMRYTDLGKALRASAEDAPVAAAFGINDRALALILSGTSAAFAGVAGACLALSYTLDPSQIYAWIGVVFAAVMIGGLGKPIGVLVAGILIGVSEAVTMAVTAPAWAPLVSFSLLIVVLLARPQKL